MSNIILGITGHRPTNIGGYKIPNPTYTKIYDQVLNTFKEINPKCIISGMALGTDQLAVKVAIESGIPFIACVPFIGQESIWPAESQKEYQRLLSLAQEVVIVSPGSYSAQKLMIRNQWIVENSDEILAVWNGQTQGGTYSCVQLAQKAISSGLLNKLHIIDPQL